MLEDMPVSHHTIADSMSLRVYPDIKNEARKSSICYSFTGTLFVTVGRTKSRESSFPARSSARSLEEADRVPYAKATWKGWKRQDRCLIGKRTDYGAFQNAYMHIWYGARRSVDKRRSAGLAEPKAKGHPLTCKTLRGQGYTAGRSAKAQTASSKR